MSKKFYEKYYDSFLGLEDVPSGYALTIEEVTYYVSENFEKFENIQKGDIVSVKKIYLCKWRNRSKSFICNIRQ